MMKCFQDKLDATANVVTDSLFFLQQYSNAIYYPMMRSFESEILGTQIKQFQQFNIKGELYELSPISMKIDKFIIQLFHYVTDAQGNRKIQERMLNAGLSSVFTDQQLVVILGNNLEFQGIAQVQNAWDAQVQMLLPGNWAANV